MTGTKTRRDLPRYADWSAITLTKTQFKACCKRGAPKELFNSNGTIRIAQTKDGNVWAEWRGDMVFWAHRWYKIPKIAYKRAKLIENLVGEIGNHCG